MKYLTNYYYIPLKKSLKQILLKYKTNTKYSNV